MLHTRRPLSWEPDRTRLGWLLLAMLLSPTRASAVMPPGGMGAMTGRDLLADGPEVMTTTAASPNVTEVAEAKLLGEVMTTLARHLDQIEKGALPGNATYANITNIVLPPGVTEADTPFLYRLLTTSQVDDPSGLTAAISTALTQQQQASGTPAAAPAGAAKASSPFSRTGNVITPGRTLERAAQTILAVRDIPLTLGSGANVRLVLSRVDELDAFLSRVRALIPFNQIDAIERLGTEAIRLYVGFINTYPVAYAAYLSRVWLVARDIARDVRDALALAVSIINLIILIATTSICFPVGPGTGTGSAGTGTGTGSPLLPSPGGGSGSGAPGGTLTMGGAGITPGAGAVGKRLLQEGGQGVVGDEGEGDAPAPDASAANSTDPAAAAGEAEQQAVDQEQQYVNVVPWLTGPQVEEALVAQGDELQRIGKETENFIDMAANVLSLLEEDRAGSWLNQGSGMFGRWSQSVHNTMSGTTGANKNTVGTRLGGLLRGNQQQGSAQQQTGPATAAALELGGLLKSLRDAATLVTRDNPLGINDFAPELSPPELENLMGPNGIVGPDGMLNEDLFGGSLSARLTPNISALTLGFDKADFSKSGVFNPFPPGVVLPKFPYPDEKNNISNANFVGGRPPLGGNATAACPLGGVSRPLIPGVDPNVTAALRIAASVVTVVQQVFNLLQSIFETISDAFAVFPAAALLYTGPILYALQVRAYEVLVRNTLPTIRQGALTRWTPILNRLADRLSARTAGSYRAQLLAQRNQLRAALNIPIPPTSRVTNGAIGVTVSPTAGGGAAGGARAPTSLPTGTATRLFSTALATGLSGGAGYGLLAATLGGNPAEATAAEGAAAVAASTPRG